MKDYIKIARPDHWIKNLFIFPGTLFALLLVGWKGSYGGLAGIALVSFFCTCMIASANYVINEWLDARFDKYHPTKKKRPVVQNTMSGKIVAAEYAVLVFRNGGLSAAGHHRAGLLAGRRVSHGHQALCRIPYDR